MKKMTAGLSILSLMALAACGGGGDGGEESAGDLVVGGKNFTEQFVLATITSIYLQENGYNVEEATNMGSEVVRDALVNEQVDLYWEYTGTALVNYLGEDPVSDGDEAFDLVKELDYEQNGITWLDRAEVDNTYTLMMRQEAADEMGIESISDLADYVNANPGELSFASNAEFASRSDGLPGAEEAYGFEFGSGNVNRMDSGLTYQALRDGNVDVSMGFSTDSRIVAFDLVNLEDDKGFFPAYNAAISIRDEILEEHPELEELLAPLAQNLDTQTMTELNYEVDIEQRNESEVAREWLAEHGLIDEE
ncbi:glycine betaine ABC transporter substrate-binding protein [Alteribacter natronophilus]|uniref:glycine betaine ABC transporter substrate-binding protein n=1 Tax=Alteribacter natronophilus TaxID=2583810 RepID=UPI00110E6E16|nr:glycine betaine ABC transporter substrate-binding protein [Alteribacter natronophilus]TMW70424.1 glycine/betaine ABC transporter substrate-binding protein [Alteribacter natronophilus]